jgi:2-keto-4-pentenoate hydratase
MDHRDGHRDELPGGVIMSVPRPAAPFESTTARAADAAERAAADRLTEAARTGRPCAPVRDLIGPDDLPAAYRVQALLATARRAAGARVVGRKIGLTSPAVQRQLGVDRPDVGVLFDDMDVSALDVVPIDRLLQPKVEAEVAFVLGTDLTDDLTDDPTEAAGRPRFTADRVRAAVAAVAPALEIVDSRIRDWDIRIADTVADNASSALFVLGPVRRTLAEVEPRDVTMVLRADGEPAAEGTGAACLGDPLAALAWLATVSLDLGVPLRAGEIVLSGALGPMLPVRPGLLVEAEISGLGAVRARFGGERR